MICAPAGTGGAALAWDASLTQRINGIHTFDAAAAGGATSAFEAAACDGEEGNDEKGLCFARTSVLTYQDERMEARFVAFHAAKRWRVRSAHCAMHPSHDPCRAMTRASGMNCSSWQDSLQVLAAWMP